MRKRRENWEGRKVASKEERNNGKNKRRQRVDYILII